MSVLRRATPVRCCPGTDSLCTGIYLSLAKALGYCSPTIAEGDGELVFVEVKTRDKSCLRPPGTAVNHKKIAHITAAADAYVRNYDIDKSVRFDVITVLQGNNSFKIDHIESAFYPPLMVAN